MADVFSSLALPVSKYHNQTSQIWAHPYVLIQIIFRAASVNCGLNVQARSFTVTQADWGSM